MEWEGEGEGRSSGIEQGSECYFIVDGLKARLHSASQQLFCVMNFSGRNPEKKTNRNETYISMAFTCDFVFFLGFWGQMLTLRGNKSTAPSISVWYLITSTSCVKSRVRRKNGRLLFPTLTLSLIACYQARSIYLLWQLLADNNIRFQSAERS